MKPVVSAREYLAAVKQQIREETAHDAAARLASEPRPVLVDVRERDEYVGPLGHIRGSSLIPLSELPTHTSELARDKPIVAVCRSGARSAQAVVLLQKAGFTDVANLAGGMLRWRAEGNPVQAARD